MLFIAGISCCPYKDLFTGWIIQEYPFDSKQVDEIIQFFEVSRPNFLPTGWIIQKYPFDSKQVDEIIQFFSV